MNKISRKAILFLAINYGLTLALSSGFYIFDLKMGGIAATLLAMVYMFMPTVAVLIVQKGIYKGDFSEYGLNFKPNIWFLVAWVGPVLFTVAAFGVSLLFPGIEFSLGMDYLLDMYNDLLTVEQVEEMEEAVSQVAPSYVFWTSILGGLFAGISINAVFAFGEEFGWRGLLQWETRNLGFWKSNLLIGAVWGLWHAPIILKGHNYPDHPELGVLMMTAWCTFLGPVFGYLRIKTKSVIAVSVMHGSLNAVAMLGVIFLSGGSDLLVGVAGLAGIIVLLAINLAIFIFDKGSLEFDDLPLKIPSAKEIA